MSRIVFNGNRAIGVIYNANGTGEAFVRVRKEVVVSAGVLNSPVILMKSGIGPRDVLEPARIPTVKSLPVGLNLQDHFIAILTFLIRNTSDVFIPERDLTPSTFQQWQQFGDGTKHFNNFLDRLVRLKFNLSGNYVCRTVHKLRRH